LPRAVIKSSRRFCSSSTARIDIDIVLPTSNDESVTIIRRLTPAEKPSTGF
jgi:hypothetical protein